MAYIEGTQFFNNPQGVEGFRAEILRAERGRVRREQERERGTYETDLRAANSALNTVLVFSTNPKITKAQMRVHRALAEKDFDQDDLLPALEKARDEISGFADRMAKCSDELTGVIRNIKEGEPE